MVNLWCKFKKLYGEIMVIECIVVLLFPSPRHLIRALVGLLFMEYIKVVAAVIKQDDKILIARRKKANILS